MADLHADLVPLSFLLGTWSGEGDGDYPTTSPFRFKETLRFEHVGDDFLLYSQESWTLDAEPLHFERGIFRPAGPGKAELVMAHPGGHVEVSEGILDGSSLELKSTLVARTPTASGVTELARRYEVSKDQLSYSIDMAMEEVPSSVHVWATLRRS